MHEVIKLAVSATAAISPYDAEAAADNDIVQLNYQCL